MTKVRTVEEEERIYSSIHKILYVESNKENKLDGNIIKSLISSYIERASDPRVIKRHLQNMINRKILTLHSNKNRLKNPSIIRDSNIFKITNPEHLMEKYIIRDIESFEKYAEKRLKQKKEAMVAYREAAVRKEIEKMEREEQKKKDDVKANIKWTIGTIKLHEKLGNHDKVEKWKAHLKKLEGQDNKI